MVYRILWFSTLFLPHGNSDPVFGGQEVEKAKITDKVIVSGQNHYPFMAHLHIITKDLTEGKSRVEVRSQCGGVIINTISVLTAAHCLLTSFSEPLIYVEAGIVDLVSERYIAQGSWVMNYVINEGFVKSHVVNDKIAVAYMCDIGIVFLEKPLEFTSTVQKAIFNKYDGNITGLEGTVIGWGLDDSGKPSKMLKEGDTTVISNSVCETSYGGIVIQPDHLCILSSSRLVSPCVGDSGGPFVVKGVVFGIMSFASREDTGKMRPCDPKQPQVLTRLSMFIEWIDEKLQEHRKDIEKNRRVYCKRRYDDAFDNEALDLRVRPRLEDISEVELI